ncbi:peptidoglycan bridge formation glycyltransferase FemA/FemB family protein [uncultured Serinicoccus sp.]|uniref:lipid II:glycine glycyltransferase FemX n=1 Tax=uncultured Serinicoccus sp. TaxID=735514 RepID=UPI0026297C07|nr:peptidoglycan bridge formation glycyltransferase FemA/FemB family protein [uncultured Serinicoccus sp.]
MALTFVTSPTAQEWDDLIAATPAGGNIFQSHEIGEVKRLARWVPRHAVVDGVALTIHEKVAPGFGKVWYAPKGPCVAEVDRLAALLPDLWERARAEGVLFVRIEPEIPETPESLEAMRSLGLVRTDPVQPHSSTVVFPLPEDEDELLAAYPAKTRNMVRRAMRDGVEVVRAQDVPETYETMWQLWQDVVRDQQLGVRSKDYHVSSWQTLVRGGHAQVLVASAHGQPVAWALVTTIGEHAEYKEGASLRDRPVPGASQLVQYEGMRWAIGRGARTYDLVGVPHSSRLDDPSHPRHGIGKFKRGFTKEVTDWVGAWDLVLRPRRYAVWERIGERVVARLQRREPGDAFW